MSTAARTLVTEQEFLALPEGTERAELIDGEVLVAPSPGFWHQELLIRIVEALRVWARAHTNVTVAMAPLDVRFGPGKILQPDAMVFGSRLAIDGEGPIDEIPVLCVEVLSKNRVYGRITKRFLYAEAGVREYWIVEPSGVVERRAGEALAELEEIRTVLETPLLPGFSLDLAALFSRER
jgi:Uma2 family endonuclease